MLPSEQIEELVALISALDRPTVIRQLREYRANFPLDFSSEFLESATIERLRHILFALCLQCKRKPAATVPSAA